MLTLVCEGGSVSKTETTIWWDAQFRKHEQEARKFPFHPDCADLSQYKKSIEEQLPKVIHQFFILSPEIKTSVTPC